MDPETDWVISSEDITLKLFSLISSYISLRRWPPPGGLWEYFCFIALDGEEEVIADLRRSADKLRIPLGVIRDNKEGDLKKYDTHYILVRPDHYIVWKDDIAPFNVENLLLKVVGC